MNAPKTERDLLKEVLQRVVRTETRLMLLGNKMGHDLSDSERVTIVPTSGTAYISSLDVPLTSIIRACHKAGVHNDTVRVVYDATKIADITV